MPRDDGDSSDDLGGSSPTLERSAVAAAAPSAQHPVVRSGTGSKPGARVSTEEHVLGGADTVAGRSQAMTAVALDGEGGDPFIGAVFADRYEITRKIGEGGMGAVYEATHKLIGKRVALKVLLDKYAQRDTIVARLEQEARLASSIGHENIVDITDFGQTVDGRTFVVMEYLDGESLAACIARDGAMPMQRAVRICKQIASALAAAHKKDIIHRDIKPENVYLVRRDDQDFVKVVDFGISKLLRPPEDDAAVSPRLTQTGMVLGTPLYMSPEQARGDDELDHRIDVYALGVILYELITGEVPFRGGNYLNVIAQVLSDEPRTPREVRPDLDIHPELEAVILKAIAKERADRYQNMEEVAADLSALLNETGVSASQSLRVRHHVGDGRSPLRVGAWAAAIAGVVGAVALIVRFVMNSPSHPAAAADAGALVAAPVRPPPPAPDAGSKRPPVVASSITLVSKPPGATVYSDGGARELGTTPYVWKPEKANTPIPLILELSGFDDGTVTVNPYLDDGNTVTVRLNKVQQGKAPRKLRTRPAGSAPPPGGTKPGDTVPAGTAGGELQGDPYGEPIKKTP